jgi:hypothetical protein
MKRCCRCIAFLLIAFMLPQALLLLVWALSALAWLLH